MTTPDPGHDFAAPAPIPVSGEIDIRAIHGAAVVHDEAADFGAYTTYTFAGAEAPVQVLPYDVNRARAWITCIATTGKVFAGSKAGVQFLSNAAIPGGTTSVSIPDPSLGASLTYKLPQPAQLSAVTFLYTAGAAAGSRFPVFDLLDAAGNTLYQSQWTNSGIAPGAFVQVCYAAGSASTGGDAFFAREPLPSFGTLPAGYQVKVESQNGGDQVSGARLLAAIVPTPSGQAPAATMLTGTVLPVAHKQPVWLAPDGTHDAVVIVAVERWES